MRPSFLEQIVRTSGDVDVYVISGDEERAAPQPGATAPKEPLRVGPYAASAAIVGLAAVVAWLAFGRSSSPTS